MEVIEYLTHARNLIEKGWTQHHFARDSNGDPVPSITSPSATCFCTLGALGRVSADHKTTAGDYTASLMHLRKFLPKKFNNQIAYFNDDPTTTKRKVLNLIDKAIKAY